MVLSLKLTIGNNLIDCFFTNFNNCSGLVFQHQPDFHFPLFPPRTGNKFQFLPFLPEGLLSVTSPGTIFSSNQGFGC